MNIFEGLDIIYLIGEMKTYLIGRYDVNGTKEYELNFMINDDSFNMNRTHQFTYPSNFKEIFILQNNKTYVFKPL